MYTVILYLAFSKTILAALFGTFALLLLFLPSKPPFLYDHTDFSNLFLAVSTTDKPVNRSVYAYEGWPGPSSLRRFTILAPTRVLFERE